MSRESPYTDLVPAPSSREMRARTYQRSCMRGTVEKHMCGDHQINASSTIEKERIFGR